MGNKRHWTGESIESYISRMSFDFVCQVREHMKANEMTVGDVAKVLKTSVVPVDLMLDHGFKHSMNTMIQLAAAVGLELTIFAHAPDRAFSDGPILGSVIRACWEGFGSPTDLYECEDRIYGYEREKD